MRAFRRLLGRNEQQPGGMRAYERIVVVDNATPSGPASAKLPPQLDAQWAYPADTTNRYSGGTNNG
jgi:hypothetical protein